MRILISGTHGFIGSSCYEYLKRQGHDVARLVRSKKELHFQNAVYWNPVNGEVQKEDFEDFDAVIHFSGKNILDGRWTKKRKQEIFLSRCRDTWLLSEVLLRLHRPPKTFITASAVGFYGDRGDESLIETSPQGKGFLADTCAKWESATNAIASRGVRVVSMRLGAVLSRQGGMLKKMLPLYRCGLGSVLGSGKQYISFIALKDLLKIIRHILAEETLEGPVNVTAPFPVMQREFSQILAKHLKKKIWLRIPAPFLRALTGEIADELLLASQKVYPAKLLKSGYAFSCPTLEMCLLSESL
ncbi:MAG: TIGR01777 family oxidoreductase [Chlamydiota bacterium]